MQTRGSIQMQNRSNGINKTAHLNDYGLAPTLHIQYLRYYFKNYNHCLTRFQNLKHCFIRETSGSEEVNDKNSMQKQKTKTTTLPKKNLDITFIICSHLQTIKAGKKQIVIMCHAYFLHFISSRGKKLAGIACLLLVFPFLFLFSFVLWFLYSFA